MSTVIQRISWGHLLPELLKGRGQAAHSSCLCLVPYLEPESQLAAGPERRMKDTQMKRSQAEQWFSISLAGFLSSNHLQLTLHVGKEQPRSYRHPVDMETNSS